MPTSLHRSLPVAAFLFVLVAFAFAPAWGDDVDGVKERLFQAKKEYDSEVVKFRKAVAEALDKREDTARQLGNKKIVDQVKAERERFEKTGELPTVYPRALQTQMKVARANLDKAYEAAVKDYVKLRADDAADAAEKERQRFHLASAFVVGKRTYLASLKPFDIKVENERYFNNNGTLMPSGEPAPHSIFLHPPARGSSQASYPLARRWYALRVAVGIPQSVEKDAAISSPVTFELLGDGKVLWTSEPVTKFDTLQTAEVRVEKVRTLTLRTSCPEHNGWAQAGWFTPILVE